MKSHVNETVANKCVSKKALKIMTLCSHRAREHKYKEKGRPHLLIVTSVLQKVSVKVTRDSHL